MICACPGRSLCARHEKVYVLDVENGWVSKKSGLKRGVRRYHKTETKLLEILKEIFGQENVISSVHPLWALSDKGVLLEYDVCVMSKHLLVEYDGLQHFEFSNFFHKTRSEFESQKTRDRLKDRLAKQNGWKLLRIKYNEDVTYGNIFKKLSTMRLTCPKEKTEY